jgi:K+-transporting ATPase ATPase C chain
MKKQFIIALKFFLIMTVVTGIVYPLIMTGFAQLAFPYKANGSLITKDGKIIGSELIGQKFDSTLYFWSRPSAIDYNPIPSGASNYGPTSDTLRKLVKARSNLFRKMNSLADTTEIPVEMIFASASGLDPHISPEAARLQANRIVKNRKFEEAQRGKVDSLIKKLTEYPQFHLLGQERINVLHLNLSLDKIK